MKVLFAIDKMKGCLTSLECGEAAALGLKRAIPDAEYVVRPLADGGEGTVRAITLGFDGVFKNVQVTGPIGVKVYSEYGIVEIPQDEPDKTVKTAIIEISSAAGLNLVPEIERDPLKTTTYGVGELINHAIDEGCRNFIIGLGGSATNDVGIGMLQALGVKFYDEKGNVIVGDNHYLTGSDLEFIDSISVDDMNPAISECSFRIACDVQNPLLGENGASAIYGPQKGLFDSEIELMDQWMNKYTLTAYESLNKLVDPLYPGCGAAGGLGFAFKYFLNGNLEAGNKIVMEETTIKKYMSDADIIVTGEGLLDEQTLNGKAPMGIAHIAKVFNKPVIALVGSVSARFDGDILPDVDAYFPVIRRSCTVNEAMAPATARMNIAATCEQVFRLIDTFNNM